MLLASGLEKSLSNSSFVKNSTCLASAFIRSIAVADKLFFHFFSKYFKNALREII
jgi:hypothetical protein